MGWAAGDVEVTFSFVPPSPVNNPLLNNLLGNPTSSAMASITVVHDDFQLWGGAEAVCMHLVDALQDRHDLTLVTTSPVGDFDELNSFFGTKVDPVETEVVGGGSTHLQSTLDTAARVGRKLGLHRLPFSNLFYAFEHAAVERQVPDDALVISTCSREIASPAVDVHYAHYPARWQIFNRACSPERAPRGPAARGVVDRIDAVARRVAGYDLDALRTSRVLANSRWTADLLRSKMGVEAEVVYPPVAVPQDRPGRPPEEREPGFLSIGRVAPDKKFLRNVEILAQVRERGHDVHYHVVGGTPDWTGRTYRRRVRERAKRHDFLTVEGRVSREQLRLMLRSHRYGIHGMEREHFGMAVAEMVASGILPFVPDSGGQREVVGEEEMLTYDGTEDAVEKIDRVLSDPATERRLRRSLAENSSRFAAGRFREQMRAVVAEELVS